jgi:hypothetical protein
MDEKERWEQLTSSYDSYFRFARTMEMGLPIVTALEFLSKEELDDISTLLTLIADQWDDEIEEKEKKRGEADIKALIGKMKKSHDKDMLVVVFRTLSEISKIEVKKTRGPRTRGK